MKLPYNAKHMCVLHKAQPSATCGECYARALEQQASQQRRESKVEHQKYLATRANADVR